MPNHILSQEHLRQNGQMPLNQAPLFIMYTLGLLVSCTPNTSEAEQLTCEPIIYDEKEKEVLRSGCNKNLPDLQVWLDPKAEDQAPSLIFGKESITNTENMVLNATFGPQNTIYLLANRVDRSAEELYSVNRKGNNIKLLGSLEQWKVSNAAEASLEYNEQKDLLTFEAMRLEQPEKPGQLPSDHKFTIGPMNNKTQKPTLKTTK